MTQQAPCLTVERLSLGYRSHPVLTGLSFTVRPGDHLCIVGENGAGKTTLLRTLLSLQEPLGGTIRYGEEIRPDEIGFLPQRTEVQKDFPATVREIVLSGCQGHALFRPFYSSEERTRAAENLERLGITALKGRSFRELSGGQQQRVLLARALCATRKLLLLDEPVAGLDPKVAADLYALIDGLNRDGVTIIEVTHDREAVLHHASHVLHLGMDRFYGTAGEYWNSLAGQRFVRAPEGGS